MKYIISESQYSLLTESVPLWVKRRLNSMDEFIHAAIADFPDLCDVFGDEFEYADNIIDRAVDDFLTVDEANMESLGDNYDQIHTWLINHCKEIYGEYLLNDYIGTCSEVNTN